MKLNKTLIIIFSMILILAGIAAATADVTYTFNKNNVGVRVYNCLDDGCSDITGWSWSGSTTNGQITIPFPASLQWPYYGYAMYFVTSGDFPDDGVYIPKEGKATWHCSDGSQCSGDGNGGQPLVFNKIPMCRGVVDSFSITNYASPESPLIVDMLAELDGDVHSAFRSAFSPVEYVPPALKDRYYSADTRLDLEIRNLDTDQVVRTDSTYYTEGNGNPIFMDSYDTFYYEWTPSEEGGYKATVTSHIIDTQCAAYDPMSAWDIFTVLGDLPRDQCWTIINNLETSDVNPKEGDTVSFSYDKISNHANDYPYTDPSYEISVIETDVTYSYLNTRTGESGQSTAILPANPNILDPTQHSFSFNFPSYGLYEITVHGIGRNCAGDPNLADTQTIELYVYPALSVSCDANPNSGLEPLDVSFTSTPHGGNSPYSYSWTFGDGSTSALRNPSHTYANEGVYAATVTVTDDDDDTASCSEQITVIEDTTPAGYVTAGVTPTEGLEDVQVFEFTCTSTSGNAPLSYSWTFGDGSTSTEQNPNHVYSDSGTYTARCTVTDNDGDSGYDDSPQITVISPNIPPTASITSPPDDSEYLQGQEVIFTGVGEDDDGNVVSYVWESTIDGVLESGNGDFSTFTTTTLSVGTHTITFTVEDDDGATASDQINVAIRVPIAPTASITAPGDGAVFKDNDVITFSGSSSDSDGVITDYEWSSNIDGVISSGSCNTQDCVMSFDRDDLSIGTHTITFTVEDNDRITMSDSIEITINELMAPIVSIVEPDDEDNFRVGDLVQFIGEATDSDGIIESYEWVSSIDGLISTQQTFSTDTLSLGLHTITFTATDDDSLMGSDSIQIEIKPLEAPIAVITSPNDGDTFNFGDDILFEGYGEDSDGLIVSYQWMSDIDGVLLEGDCNLQRCEFSFIRNDLSLGRHDITLTVYDNDVLMYSDTDTVWILVNPLLAPDVEIILPEDGAEFFSDEFIDFSGTASDPDGYVVSYEWTSDIFGTLVFGTGYPEDFSMQLPAGEHLITLIAVDDDGQAGQDFVNIRVYNRECVDNDGDGHYAISDLCLEGDDCDDSDGDNFPGNTESCDYQDNNCDSQTDEDFTDLGDTCTEGIGQCEDAGIYVCTADGLGTECDATPSTPAADDALCDGLDNDCDGSTDEDYVSMPTSCGAGECAASGTLDCIAGSEVDSCSPGTPNSELCDGLDNDCDGDLGDDGIDEIWYNDPTTCGIGGCESTGNLLCIDGIQTDSCTPGTPDADDSLCDGIDNDCDAQVDEDYVDTPTSCGIGECAASGLLQCVSGSEIDSCSPGTPAADDALCDGLDNDCDGSTDEDYVSMPTSCGAGECAASGTLDCIAGSEVDSCSPGTPSSELCDGLDNDCDGTDDNGFTEDQCDYVCTDYGYVWTNNGGNLNCCGDDSSEDDPYEITETTCDDGHDNDCDGLIDFDDPDCIILNCVDADGDGHYAIDTACLIGDDCDDSDGNNFPGNPEIDDDLDQNCMDEATEWIVELEDQEVEEDSADGTVVYEDIQDLCRDVDDVEVFSMISSHTHYDLAFSGDDLIINNLEADYSDNIGETVTVSCNSVPASFELTIGSVNDAPRIISKPVTTLVESDPYNFVTVYEYDVDAVDPEGDTITYSLLESPSGMTIDSSTGLIEWVPAQSQLGRNEVSVQASDGALADVQSFTVTVSLPKKETYPREKIGWTQLELLNQDEVRAGDDLLALITFTNRGLYDMEHTRITLMVPELALRNRIGPFRVDAGESATRLVPLEIPYDVEPGAYDLRLTVANDGVTRIKHRDFTVN